MVPIFQQAVPGELDKQEKGSSKRFDTRQLDDTPWFIAANEAQLKPKRQNKARHDLDTRFGHWMTRQGEMSRLLGHSHRKPVAGLSNMTPGGVGAESRSSATRR
jgi:hypothetical protein